MIKLCHQMSKISGYLKLHSSYTPIDDSIGHLLADVSNGIHSKADKSQKQPKKDKLYHQNSAPFSKIPKKNDRPMKDPGRD